MEVKAEIFENMMVLSTDTQQVTVKSSVPFTTNRLLVGTFDPALNCMKDGLNQLGAVGLFKLKPNMIIQPKSMVEGGLSEVEERCLLELGLSAGASKVEIRI